MESISEKTQWFFKWDVIGLTQSFTEF
jgi:hypothetical protein